MEISRSTPAASTRASTQPDTQRWHDSSQDPPLLPHSGASPSDPANVYRVPSMDMLIDWSAGSAQDTTYLKNSRASGSRRPLAVSALAVSALAVSALAVSALAVSALAVSAFTLITAPWTSSTAASPPQPAAATQVETSPRQRTRAPAFRAMVVAS